VKIVLEEFTDATDLSRVRLMVLDMIGNGHRSCGYGYADERYYFARKMKSGSLIINRTDVQRMAQG